MAAHGHAPSLQSRRNELLGKVLLKLGLADREQVRTTLGLVGNGEPPERFGPLLVERGVVTSDGLTSAEAFIRRNIVLCSGCLVPHGTTGRAPGERFDCPGCGRALEVAATDPEGETRRVERPRAPRVQAGSRPAAVERLGQLELIEPIGQGGMGVVYRAYDPALGREVALKRIKAEEASPAQVERFFREVKAAARLQHPNIVRVHQVGQEGERWYFTMDLVRGRTLKEAIAAGHVPQYRAYELCARLAGALHYAHTQGVIHRDVNPRNILLDAAGEPLLMDFGIAKEIGDESNMTRSGTPIGTPAYMSPEQATGDLPRIDPRTDVYSLGAVLYEMLTGRVPFPMEQGESLLALFSRIVNQDPIYPRRINPKIDRDGETIALKALAKEPGKRYASALELQQDLQRHLNDEPILARPYSVSERVWRRVRRNKLTSALLLLVVLLVLGGAALAVKGELRAGRRVDELFREAERLRDSKRIPELQRAEASFERILEIRPDSFLALRGRTTVRERIERLRKGERNAQALPHVELWRQQFAVARRRLDERERTAQKLQAAIAARRRPQARELASAATGLLRGARDSLDLAADALSKARVILPAAPELRAGLLQTYFHQFLVAERLRQPELRAVYERLVLQLDTQGEYARALAARGSFELALERPARIVLSRIDRELASGRAIERETARVEGARKLARQGMPAGDYVLDILPDGGRHVALRLPFRLRRGSRPALRPALPLRHEALAGMVYIPGGTATVGGDPAAFQALQREQVHLPPFWIARHEVTFGQYLEFLRTLEGRAFEAAVPRRGGTPLFAWLKDKLVSSLKVQPEMPVVYVSQPAAAAYAAWLAKKTGVRFRMPDELEWEKAARGSDERYFPWGDRFDRSGLALVAEPGRPLIFAPVGHAREDRSIYGVRDLAGSVEEWTASLEKGMVVCRGGSYLTLRNLARAAKRNLFGKQLQLDQLGFRLAADPVEQKR